MKPRPLFSLLSPCLWLSISALLVSANPAAALSCGDTIGPQPKGRIIFTEDIGPCAGPGPALTIIGPARVEMKKYTVSCLDAGIDGIHIKGQKVFLRDGVIEGCANGLRISGDGNHRISKMATRLNMEDGITLLSDKNAVIRSTSRGNGSVGFRIVGEGNRLKSCEATGNGKGIVIQGALTKTVGVKSFGNSDEDFVSDGIRITASRDSRLMQAHKNNNTGLWERLNFKTGMGKTAPLLALIYQISLLTPSPRHSWS